MIRTYGIVFLLVTIGCLPDKNREVDISDLGFSTSDASELYFKNVRESYYDVDDRLEQGLKVYRYEDWNLDAEYPLINLSIVFNWRNDNAFVMANPNDYMPQKTQIAIGTDTLIFEQSNMKAQLEVASKIYNGIVREERISIHLRSEWIDFLNKSEDRQNFKITMYDFYRMTEVF